MTATLELGLDLGTATAMQQAIAELHSKTNFYTREPVVEELLDRVAWPAIGGRLVDPSAGDGSFLVAALRRLRLRPNDVVGAKRVVGCEIHGGAVIAARENIVQALCRDGWSAGVAYSVAKEMVHEADFLIDFSDRGEFRVVAGNPPYLAYLKIPAPLQALYAQAVVDYARSDILHAFLDKCSTLLHSGGRIALVVADRWLTNLSTARLRSAVGQRVEVVHANRLDHRTTFYRAKKQRVTGAAPRVHPVAMIFAPIGGGFRPMSREPFFVDDLLAPVKSNRTLGDIADVRMAPWVGKDGIFIVPRTVAESLAGAEVVPVIDTPNIPADQDIVAGEIKYLIRTPRDGTLPSAAVQSHVSEATRDFISRLPAPDREAAMNTHWKDCADRFMTPEAVRLPCDREGLLLPSICRRLRPIRFPAGMIPVNRTHVVYARSGGPSLEEIETLLRSDVSQEWLVRAGKPIENGFYTLGTKMLRQLPVP